jgi:hypothetical protein
VSPEPPASRESQKENMQVLRKLFSHFRNAQRKKPSPDRNTNVLTRGGIFFLVISKESVLEKNVAKFESFVDSVCLA